MTRNNMNKAESKSGRIFERLREDLLNGQFESGEKLAISALRESYGVGLSPLREALNRLAASGLLEQEDQRGFRVPKLSRSDLDDIVQLRIELECMAITKALEFGDADWESELLAAGHRLKHASKGDLPLKEWERLHSRFHEVLLSSCRSTWMLRFIRQLHEQFDRYRRQAPHNPAIRGTLDEQHGLMVKYALERDVDSAVQLVQEHILLSSQAALASCIDDSSAA